MNFIQQDVNDHITPEIILKEEENHIVKVKIFNGHRKEVNCCCLSKDYKTLVTAADDLKLLVWDVARQRIMFELVGHTGPVNCCTFSPDNTLIASASYDCSIRFWKLASGICCSTLQGHSKSVEFINFSKDGFYLCSASWDKLVILWDVKTGSLISQLPGHLDCVKTCCFSNQSSLIGSGSWDGEVRVWRLDDNNDNREHSKNMQWNLRRFEKIPSCNFRVAILKEHTGNVQSVTFSNAGLMASGSWDRSICLWDPYRVQLLKKFLGHTGWVKGVCFSLNSVELVSSADDDSVRVWNVISGECTKVFPAYTDVAHHCFFSTSGNLVTFGTALMK